MDLCSHNHPEICHDERDCPLCAKVDELTDSEAEIKRLEKELAAAEQRADEAEEQE